MPDETGDLTATLARLNEALRILTEHGGPPGERVRQACQLVITIPVDSLPERPRSVLEFVHAEARAWPQPGTPPDDATALRLVPKLLELRAQVRRCSGLRDPLSDTVKEGRRPNSTG